MRLNKKKIYIVLTSLFFVVLSVYYCFSQLNRQHNFTYADKYEVAAGQSLRAVTDDLVKKGILFSPKLLYAYARITGKDSDLQVGEYLLNSPLSALELLDIFVSGKVISYSVTLVEGADIETIFNKVAALPQIERTLPSIEHLSQKLQQEFGVDKHIEGLLYADTYNYTAATSDWDIFKIAYLRMQAILNEQWQQRQANLPYESSYDALILASIIEKETAIPSERQRIASVYINRLNSNMRLQADPTVIYGLQLLGKYTGDLTKSNLKYRTSYNTYRNKGLPPTPIAAVSLAAIHAALNPALTDELFFVAKPDGSHYFSRTLQEHNKAVRKYQKGMQTQ